MTKAEARQYIRQQRKQLSEDAYRQTNRQLRRHLFAHLQKLRPRTVHCFLPIAKNREVDTWPVIRHLQQQNIRVVVPRSDLHSNCMEHFLVEPHTPCLENAWGIPEPTGDSLLRIQEHEMDTVLLPLMTFDTTGERVGYGKGYYDRFLAVCRPEAVKVGLSLFDPVEEIADTTPLDVRLDAAVTPDRIWIFSESGNTSA